MKISHAHPLSSPSGLIQCSDRGVLLRINWRVGCRAARTRENCTSEFGNFCRSQKFDSKSIIFANVTIFLVQEHTQRNRFRWNRIFLSTLQLPMWRYFPKLKLDFAYIIRSFHWEFEIRNCEFQFCRNFITKLFESHHPWISQDDLRVSAIVSSESTGATAVYAPRLEKTALQSLSARAWRKHADRFAYPSEQKIYRCAVLREIRRKESKTRQKTKVAMLQNA